MHCIKRLHNEIVELYNKYENFTVIYKKTEIEFILGRFTSLNGVSQRGTDLNGYKIVIPKEYPFRVPKLYLLKSVGNCPIEISYIDSLRTKSPRILKYLEYYYDGCICCKTMLIHTNWFPTYHIEKILQEIEINNEIKCTIKYHLVLDDIICKYIYKMDKMKNAGTICGEYSIDLYGLSANIKLHIMRFLDIEIMGSFCNKSLCSFRTKDKLLGLGFTPFG